MTTAQENYTAWLATEIQAAIDDPDYGNRLRDALIYSSYSRRRVSSLLI